MPVTSARINYANRVLYEAANLTPEELAYYKRLFDPDEVRRFIVTRSYEHLCQQVIDRKLPPSQLPDKPVDLTVKYLSRPRPRPYWML